jgi:anti-anti-sigma regulatory factor
MGSRPVGGPVIVALPPEIDAANAEQACEKLYEAFASGAAVVIADLTATTFCDSSGIQQMRPRSPGT